MNCTSINNPKAFTLKVNSVIQAAAKLCMCSGCCEAKTYSKKDSINLYKFCRLYRNYNTQSGFGQCISAKLWNQCYQVYYDFKKVIDDEFGVDKINPGAYLSTVCFECNGCNENCQQRIYDNNYPIPLGGGAGNSVAVGSLGGASDSAVASVLAGGASAAASSSGSAIAALARPGRPIL